MEYQGTPNIQKNLEKAVYKVGYITLSDFKTYCRHIIQWNRIESPEANPYIDGQIVFWKVCQDSALVKI